MIVWENLCGAIRGVRQNWLPCLPAGLAGPCAAMALEPCVLWLSTFCDEVRYKDTGISRRFYLNRYAMTADVRLQLQEPTVAAVWESTQSVLPDGAVIGALRAVPDGEYHHLLRLTRAERQQYNLWQQQLQCGTVGTLKRLRVLDVCLFRNAAPLQRCGDSRLRGFIVTLEAGQPNRLAQELDVEPGWLRQAQDLPAMALRLPAPHAVLVGVGAWCRVWLPDLPAHRGRWSINWKAFGCVGEPAPAAWPEIAIQGAEPLGAKTALNIADLVRDLAARPAGGEGNAEAGAGADEALKLRAYKAACSLQQYFDECNPEGLAYHLVAICLASVSHPSCKYVLFALSLFLLPLGDRFQSTFAFSPGWSHALHR